MLSRRIEWIGYDQFNQLAFHRPVDFIVDMHYNICKYTRTYDEKKIKWMFAIIRRPFVIGYPLTLAFNIIIQKQTEKMMLKAY